MMHIIGPHLRTCWLYLRLQDANLRDWRVITYDGSESFRAVGMREVVVVLGPLDLYNQPAREWLDETMAYLEHRDIGWVYDTCDRLR